MATFEQIQLEIAAMLDLADEDLSEEQKAELDAYLQDLATAESAKVDAFAGFVKEQAGRVETLKKMAQELTARAKAIDNKIARLKKYYQDNMGRFNLNKVAGSVYTISLRNNKSVLVEDGALESLPLIFKNIKVEPRKADIKRALEEGQELAGCKIVETQSLNIR